MVGGGHARDRAGRRLGPQAARPRPRLRDGVALLRGAPAATVAAAVYGFLLPFGPARPAPALATECGAAVASNVPGAQAVSFTAGDGVHLHGDVFGDGPTTVVLAHEFPSRLCGWFPYAAELARAGLRVLAFDSRTAGTRLDLDVVAAVDEAGRLGAERGVAMGASLGGAATLVAAGRDCFLVSGIVSASGETDLRGFGAGVHGRLEQPPNAKVAMELDVTRFWDLVIGAIGAL